MACCIHPTAGRAPWPGAAAVATLFGLAVLLVPMIRARGETVPAPTLRLAQAATPQQSTAAPLSPAAAGATEPSAETVEQRIAALHAALQITPGQDGKWQAVAQAMRQNASAMEKLAAATAARPRGSMTAIDDLNVYQTFAQAHVDGLKNLIDDFKALYAVMPDAQKKIADGVFRSSGG